MFSFMRVWNSATFFQERQPSPSVIIRRRMRAGSADVIIIGGGIVGSSIAYHLTAAGCRNVLVLERESHQGKGSTGKSMGGVRAQFSTAVNIQMSLYSIPFFGRFEEMTGHPSGYRPQGYLFVAANERHLEYLRANYQRQIAMGLKTVELLKAEDVMRLVPQLRPDDIAGGSFSSTDGFVDPYSVMKGFTLRASDRGARLWRDEGRTRLREPEIGRRRDRRTCRRQCRR